MCTTLPPTEGAIEDIHVTEDDETDESQTTDGRRLRGRQTREEILEAAEAEFAANGFAGTSVRDLAKACGVSQALLYHHFETKEGLFSAVVQRFLEQEGPTFFEDLEILEDMGEFLVRGMHAHFWSHLRHPHLARLTAWIMLESHRWDVEQLEEPMEWALEKVKQGQQAGFLRPELDARVMWLMQDASVTYWMQMKQTYAETFRIDAEDPAVDEFFVRQALDILIRGVGTERLVQRWEELKDNL